MFFFFFSSRRRHTRCSRDWSSDVCSSDLPREDIRPRGEAHRSDRWREADLHGWVVGAPAALRNRAAAAVVCRGVVAGSVDGVGACGPCMDFRMRVGRKTPPKRTEPPPFFRRHARTLLAGVLALLFVHDIFGAHGFMAMRRTEKEIERLRSDMDRLNAENQQLGDEVKALRSDPKLIERIAREEMGLARPGEIIIRLPPPVKNAKPKP